MIMERRSKEKELLSVAKDLNIIYTNTIASTEMTGTSY